MLHPRLHRRGAVGQRAQSFWQRFQPNQNLCAYQTRNHPRHQRPEEKPLDCGDLSPLWPQPTCRRVWSRGCFFQTTCLCRGRRADDDLPPVGKPPDPKAVTSPRSPKLPPPTERRLPRRQPPETTTSASSAPWPLCGKASPLPMPPLGKKDCKTHRLRRNCALTKIRMNILIPRPVLHRLIRVPIRHESRFPFTPHRS